MKLLYCPNCMDAQQLSFKPTICKCGLSSGCYVYPTDKNAEVEIKGLAKVLVIPNHKIAEASMENDIEVELYEDDLGAKVPCWFLSKNALSVSVLKDDTPFCSAMIDAKEEHKWLAEDEYLEAAERWDERFDSEEEGT